MRKMGIQTRWASWLTRDDVASSVGRFLLGLILLVAIHSGSMEVWAVCTGAPCPLPEQCRSEFGFCDVTPDHCNQQSIWNATGCTNINDNGCPGASCVDPNHCRSKFNFCGSTAEFCNSESIFRPEGCPGFTKSPTTRAPTPPTRAPTPPTKAPTPPTRAPTPPTNSPTPPTNAPTPPTNGPTPPTGAPTPPTNAPTQPTKAPTPPTNAPTPPTNPPTSAPTLLGDTRQPTASPEVQGGNNGDDAPNDDELNADDSSAAVFAGVGSGVGLLALATVVVLHRRRSQRKRQELTSEEWTWHEERALKEMFLRTHDFEELCKVVPQRSRESVAIRTRVLLEKERRSTLMHSLMAAPSNGYLFITERTRKWVPPIISYQFVVRAPSTKNLMSFRSFNNNNNAKKPPMTTVMTPGSIAMNPTKGMTQSRIISENPMYFTGY